ncbi:MAG: hypothetical protein ABJM82_21825 [Shimia thalassica]
MFGMLNAERLRQLHATTETSTDQHHPLRDVSGRSERSGRTSHK